MRMMNSEGESLARTFLGNSVERYGTPFRDDTGFEQVTFRVTRVLPSRETPVLVYRSRTEDGGPVMCTGSDGLQLESYC
jgi:hypothetical protein